MEISDFFIGFFVIVGAFFSIVTAIGLIRLPDIYTRTHAASKSSTLGVMCILIGTLIFFFTEEGLFNSRIVLGIFFVLITAPVGGHLIARAAYNKGVKLADESIQDDLAKKDHFETKSEEYENAKKDFYAEKEIYLAKKEIFESKKAEYKARKENYKAKEES